MSSSIVLEKSLSYSFATPGDKKWLLTVAVSTSTDAPTNVFLLRRKKSNINSYVSGTTTYVAHPFLDSNATNNLITAWKWSDAVFQRVVTRSELTTVLSVDPSANTGESYLDLVPQAVGGNSPLNDLESPGAAYPYNSSESTYIKPPSGENVPIFAGTASLGDHLYRDSTFSKLYDTWEAAEGAYTAIKALVGSLVNPEDGVSGALRVTAPAGIPRRETSVDYSMYPGDTVVFVASGGTGDYAYHLSDGHGTDSYIDSSGRFVASKQINDPVKTVVVNATDLLPDGQNNNTVSLTVKVYSPSNLDVQTAISSGDYT